MGVETEQEKVVRNRITYCVDKLVNESDLFFLRGNHKSRGRTVGKYTLLVVYDNEK